MACFCGHYTQTTVYKYIMAATKEQYFKFNEVEKDGAEWVKKCLTWSGNTSVNALSSLSFTGSQYSKGNISKELHEAIMIVNRQNMLIANLREQAQVLKTETIRCQASIIRLQEELISAKDQQLGALQTAVVSSVEETVKTEFQSYSEAVKVNLSQSTSTGTVYNPETLKIVVKDVVEEEDRNRNLMVFGLPESNNEQLNEKISEVFEQLCEKPTVEATRLGRSKSPGSNKPRPVKVTLSSSTIVQQIIRKARNLRSTDKYKTVFVAPDRSVEQRALQKQLVTDLKKKKKEEPNKRHYLKGGQICSQDITAK